MEQIHKSISLVPLFSPRSIAVIGASTKEGSVGHSLTENLLKNGYQGRVYPVNPKTDRLFDRVCYPRLEDVPEIVDLAIIIIPATAVPQVLESAGAMGIKACVIISSGFKETGEAGARLESEIIAIAKKYGLALLGPNCLGFLQPALGLNASFSRVLPQPGSIAFFSQSGALATALLDLSQEILGFASFVSTGNKAVLDEKSFLDFFAHQKDAAFIGFYTEGISGSTEFIRLGRELLESVPPKLAIALKSGQTPAGTRASSSHTGALAGSAQAYGALFRQARITQAHSLEELFNFLQVFSQNPLPQGKRLAILTNAGGLGVLATDAASLSGLELANLSEKTLKTLAEFLPPAASVKNPIDILGDADGERYARSLEAVADDKNVDMLLVIVTPQTTTEAALTAEAIVQVRKKSDKPIVAIFAGAKSLEPGTVILRQEKVATLLYPEAGVEALAALAQAAEWRNQKEITVFEKPKVDHAKAARVFRQARVEKRDFLSENQTTEILQAYGFPLLKSAVVHSLAEIEPLLEKWDEGLYALKIVSRDIIHKSEAGGVILGIAQEDIAEEYKRLLERVAKKAPEARIEGVLVMEMAKPGGLEILLGMKREEGLGALLAIGLGGIYVETLGDLSYRFAPLTRTDAEEMLTELKSAPILSGTRGQKGIDKEALIDYLGRLSALVIDFPEIAEIDINPLLAFPAGRKFCVLDARIRINAGPA